MNEEKHIEHQDLNNIQSISFTDDKPYEFHTDYFFDSAIEKTPKCSEWLAFLRVKILYVLGTYSFFGIIAFIFIVPICGEIFIDKSYEFEWTMAGLLIIITHFILFVLLPMKGERLFLDKIVRYKLHKLDEYLSIYEYRIKSEEFSCLSEAVTQWARMRELKDKAFMACNGGELIYKLILKPVEMCDLTTVASVKTRNAIKGMYQYLPFWFIPMNVAYINKGNSALFSGNIFVFPVSCSIPVTLQYIRFEKKVKTRSIFEMPDDDDSTPLSQYHCAILSEMDEGGSLLEDMRDSVQNALVRKGASDLQDDAVLKEIRMRMETPHFVKALKILDQILDDPFEVRVMNDAVVLIIKYNKKSKLKENGSKKQIIFSYDERENLDDGLCVMRDILRTMNDGIALPPLV